MSEEVAPQPAMDLEQALETLRIVKSVFAEANVNFTLAAGTLLGAVRQGRFMSWDYDTDLSCSDELDGDKLPLLAKRLNDRGVTAYYSEELRCLAVYHRGVTIDIDFWRRDGNDLTMPLRFAFNPLGKFIFFLEWLLFFRATGGIELSVYNRVNFPKLRYALSKFFGILPFKTRSLIGSFLRTLARATNNPRGLVRVPAEFFREFGTISFCGMEFLTPIDVDGYLSNRYGEDWRKPQPGWVYYNERGEIFSKSQVPRGNWEFRRFSSIR